MIFLHFSPRAAIHGAEPCDHCGGPTNYWHATTKTPMCPNCADELNDENPDGEVEPAGLTPPSA